MESLDHNELIKYCILPIRCASHWLLIGLQFIHDTRPHFQPDRPVSMRKDFNHLWHFQMIEDTNTCTFVCDLSTVQHVFRVGCHYNTVQWYNMIFHTALQWLRQKINQGLNSQWTPHTSTHEGEVWGIYCEDFGENWPFYYATMTLHSRQHPRDPETYLLYFPWHIRVDICSYRRHLLLVYS